VVTLALVTVALVALQVSIVSPLRVGGVVLMVVWLWPFAVGLTGSTAVAVTTGLLAGLLFDSTTATPYGLTGLVGAAIGWGISLLAREGIGDLDGSAWWVPALLAGLAGAAAPLLYVAAGALVGHLSFWRAGLSAMMGLNFVGFFVLARPLARLAQRVALVGGWARG
jgi:hypothetical protein